MIPENTFSQLLQNMTGKNLVIVMFDLKSVIILAVNHFLVDTITILSKKKKSPVLVGLTE